MPIFAVDILIVVQGLSKTWSQIAIVAPEVASCGGWGVDEGGNGSSRYKDWQANELMSIAGLGFRYGIGQT